MSDSATPWTVALQAPLSMGSSRPQFTHLQNGFWIPPRQTLLAVTLYLWCLPPPRSLAVFRALRVCREEDGPTVPHPLPGAQGEARTQTLLSVQSQVTPSMIPGSAEKGCQTRRSSGRAQWVHLKRRPQDWGGSPPAPPARQKGPCCQPLPPLTPGTATHLPKPAMADLLQVQKAVPAQVCGLEQLHCNRAGGSGMPARPPSSPHLLLPFLQRGCLPGLFWEAAQSPLPPPDGGFHQEQGACCPRKLWTCKPHLGMFLSGSGKAVSLATGTSQAADSGPWSRDQHIGKARQAVWLGRRPWGGGQWSGPSPHPCHRLAFQRQAPQRLFCWGLLGTALYGTHWSHSPEGWAG